MFAAARERIGQWRNLLAWPRDRRRSRLLRLFLFEFVVVVLGVLVAQSLQDYASRVRERSDMRTQRARADFQIADSRRASEYWLQLAPCLSAQMDRVMLAASSGATPRPADIATPRYLTSRVAPWSEPTILALRRTEGDEVAAHYVALVDIAAFQTDHIRRLSREWAPMGLADERRGAMTEADRVAVRLAATRVQAELERIISNSRSVIRRASALGIEAYTVDPVPELPLHCRS